jgi:hypothetical protein
MVVSFFSAQAATQAGRKREKRLPAIFPKYLNKHKIPEEIVEKEVL